MSTIEKVSIAMSSDMLRMVRAAVASGDYASASEVVREALRHWKLWRAEPASAAPGASSQPIWPLSRLQREELQRLCEQFAVRRLALFGSALRPDFSPASDIDLVVEFGDAGTRSLVDQYFGFKSALEGLFARPVDLVELDAMPDSRLKRHIQQTQRPVYGDREAA